MDLPISYLFRCFFYFFYFLFFYYYYFIFIIIIFVLNIFAISSPENETLDISLGVLPGDTHLVFWIRVRDSPEKGEIQEGVGAH